MANQLAASLILLGAVPDVHNYVNLTADYPTSEKVGDLELQPFGVGAGVIGLPGDFTPPSRFVRMVFFTQNVPEITRQYSRAQYAP